MLQRRRILALPVVPVVLVVLVTVGAIVAERSLGRRSSSIGGPDTLPSRLSDRDFWQLSTNLSEPNGYFRSDNFLSNELTYQRVIPTLASTLPPGGVYMGV